MHLNYGGHFNDELYLHYLFQRIMQLLTPTHHWQPNDASARETYRLQPYKYQRSAWMYFRLNSMGPKDNPVF